jgi:hypothetical protein
VSKFLVRELPQIDPKVEICPSDVDFENDNLRPDEQ